MLTLNQNVTKLNLTLTQSGVSIQVQPVITIKENFSIFDGNINEIDGGTPDSVYLVNQFIDGGNITD